MRRHRRKMGKRLTAMALAALMVVTSITFVPVQEVQAGGISAAVAKKLGEKVVDWTIDATKEYAERGICYGMEEASNAMDGKNQALNVALRLMKSSEENQLDEVIELCEEILDELNEVENGITAIRAQVAEVGIEVKALGINDQIDVMNAFTILYQEPAEAYKDLIEAAKAYAENPEDQDSQTRMENAYGTLKKFYNKMKDLEGKKGDIIDDIYTYGNVNSKYHLADTVEKEGTWTPSVGDSTIKTTYLGAIASYYKDVTASQPLMYKALYANLNDALKPIYYYLRDLQIYTLMSVNEINANTDLSRTERDKQIQSQWNRFEKGKNRAANLVNQMCYEAKEDLKIDTLMRPYDMVPTKVTMDYQEKRDVKLYSSPDSTEKRSLVSKKTKETMGYSILKLTNGTTYAIYSEGAGNATITLGDLIDVTHGDFLMFHMGTCTDISCDYLNLFQGKDAWSGFSLIPSSANLESLTSEYNSYALAKNELWNYLQNTEKIPNLVSGYTGEENDRHAYNPFYGITSHYGLRTGGGVAEDMSIYFYPLQAVSSDTPGAATEEKSLESEIYDKRGEGRLDYPVGIIMQQSAGTEVPLNLSIPTNQEISIKVENLDKTDASGNATVVSGDENGNYTIDAGNRITVKVKINDTTKDIRSAKLKGELADGEMSDMDTFVAESDAQDFTNFRTVDEDGYYTLTSFPMPYRNSEIEIKTCEDTTPNCYLAELKQPETGAKNIQFDGMPGVDYEAVDAGSEIRVVVWPEENQIANGITITDNDGNVLQDVVVTEVDNRQSDFPKETRSYTFTMPESDVVISANLESGYKAILKDTKDGKLTFADENGQALKYSTNEAAYQAGERVYVKGIADIDSYYCSDIRVNCQESGKYVRVRIEKEGISFIMPEEDVQITGEFEEKGGDYEVAVDTVKMNETSNGTVTTEEGESASKIYYKAGDKVTLIAKPAEGSWVENCSVKKKGSASDKEVNIQCETMQENLGFQKITFIMPRQNVDVQVTFNSDTSVTYNGILSVENGLKGTILEKKEDTQTEILSDVTDGEMSFTARSAYKYLLQVETTAEGVLPEVKLKKENTEQTLSSVDENGYLYSVEDITGDFTIEVKNVGEKVAPPEDLKYDYLIPDYETLLTYSYLSSFGTEEQKYNYKHAHYLVTADIIVPDDAVVYQPFGAFYGVFDGGGHKISGLKMKATLLQQGFMIGLMKDETGSGQIRNLELENVTAEGGVAGGGFFTTQMQGGAVIENCKVTGDSVLSGSEKLGGIAGFADDSNGGTITIRNCEVSGKIILEETSGEHTVGGIVGKSAAVIENSAFTGTITTDNPEATGKDSIGGIAGTQTAKIWNCYVGNGFVSDEIVAGHPGKETRIYDIGSDQSKESKCYVASEMQAKLNAAAENGQIIYSEDGQAISKSESELKNDTFAKELNQNISDEKGSEATEYKEWNREDHENNGYPYLEEPALMESHTVTIKSVPESSTLKIVDEDGEKDQVTRCNTEKVELIGTTNLSQVQIVVKTVNTGETIRKTLCTPDVQGNIGLQFAMPEDDVEVYMTEAEIYAGKISVDTGVIPTDMAEMNIQDVQGNAISEAAIGETIYLGADWIEKGYEIGKFIFKSNVNLKPYKTIDAKDTLQEDGRYAVTLDESEDILRGKVTIYAVLQKKSYTIGTSVTPEDSGTIEISTDSAKAGDEVSYTVTAIREDYSCKSLLLCDEAGNILEMLNCAESKGTFTMPAKNVVLKAAFRGATYNITTKNSENVILGAADENGNSVKFAKAGDEITVHYSRNAWTAFEQISVYKADEYESKNATPIQSWMAKRNTDAGEENPFTFTMPEKDVVIVAEELPEGDYDISKEAEGEGKVYVRDMVSGSKETASEGERIFAAAFAEKGWSLKGNRVTVYDENNNEVELVERDKFVTFTMPAKNLKVKATFVQNDYVITVEQPEKGTISITDKDGKAVDLAKVHYGDELKIKVTGNDMASVHYKETGAENASVANISLDENKEAVFNMPDMNITIGEGSKLEQDVNGNYEIRNFEELKIVSEIVKEEPKANFRLMNDISGNGQTLTEPIGSETVPYAGTFDGYGYYIFNFNMKNADGDSALFGTIGTSGTVKRLGIFYQTVTGKRASGIASINNGMIDECISGSNLTSNLTKKNGETIALSNLTTFAKGEEMAGGVAIENNGTIRNTASYANVTASAKNGVAGGIAAVNNGVIENSFSRGFAEAGGTAGGIAGKITENGSIDIAYSASDSIKASAAGAIYGENKGTVSNTYYLKSLSGTQQGIAMDEADMRDDSFADKLNTLAPEKEELCEWYHQGNKNIGYPVLRSSVIEENELTDINTNLTVRGRMHVDSKLKVEKLSSKSEAYQAFEKYAKENNLQVQLVAEPSLIYANGDEAPTEGMLTLKIDLSKYKGKGYKALVYKDGKVEVVTADEQMIANRETEELATFAVLTEKTSAEGNSSKKDDTTKTAAAKTGDHSHVVFWLGIMIAAVVLAGVVITVRRKKGNQDGNNKQK